MIKQQISDHDAGFRIDRGEAMMYVVDTSKAKLKNRHHFSKEPLAVLCTTNIVPKGSPLLVISFLLKLTKS